MSCRTGRLRVARSLGDMYSGRSYTRHHRLSRWSALNSLVATNVRSPPPPEPTKSTRTRHEVPAPTRSRPPSGKDSPDIVSVPCVPFSSAIVAATQRGEAGRLSDLLMSRFSDQSVFMDVDSIAPWPRLPQSDRRKHPGLQRRPRPHRPQLAGRPMTSAAAADSTPPTTTFRLEISAALRRDIPVIPILIRNAKMPHEDSSFRRRSADLAYRNSVELTHARWRSDLQVPHRRPRTSPRPHRKPPGLRRPQLSHPPSPLVPPANLPGTFTISAPAYPPAHSDSFQPHPIRADSLTTPFRSFSR